MIRAFFVAVAFVLLCGCGSQMDRGQCVGKLFVPAHSEARTGRRFHKTGEHLEMRYDGENFYPACEDDGYMEDYTYYVQIPDRWAVSLFEKGDGKDRKLRSDTIEVSPADYQRATEGEYFYLHPPEATQ